MAVRVLVDSVMKFGAWPFTLRWPLQHTLVALVSRYVVSKPFAVILNGKG